MNDGAVTPTAIVQSLVLGQLSCRRLWSRDGSIHDGFMGLVSSLDQLGLQVLCVQPLWIISTAQSVPPGHTSGTSGLVL